MNSHPRNLPSNLRVQATDSRATALADERKGRATRPAPDTRRYTDKETADAERNEGLHEMTRT